MVSTVLSSAPDHGADRGHGLFARMFDDGTKVLTNVRVAGKPADRKPGSGLIGASMALLALLAIGLFAVSLRAQYAFVLAQGKPSNVSLIEAVSLDLAMCTFSTLSLGLARAGKPARVERALILVTAAGSAGMNYLAADTASLRSVAVYVLPPILLSIVIDRVVAGVRRHVLGDQETSPWSAFGKGAIYGLRLLVAAPSTLAGVRRAILLAAPLPEKPEPKPALVIFPDLPKVGPVLPVPPKADEPKAIEPTKVIVRTKASTRPRAATRARSGAPSKTQRFLELVERERGPLAQVSLDDVYKLSKELAEGKIGLDAGSARTALRKAILAAQGGEAR